MSLLDALFGASSTAAPAAFPREPIGLGGSSAPGLLGSASAPPADGATFGDRLMSPLAQVGLQLLANHGTPKTQRGMFEGVPEAVATAQVYGDKRREKAEAQQKLNGTIAWLEQSDPEVAAMVRAGMDVGDAYQLALERKKLAQGPDPTSEMQNFRLAQADPAFADYLRRRSGSGGVDLETIYVDGGEQKGYLQGDQFVPVGGVKSNRSSLTADDKRAIREADDIATSADSAITLLDRAAKLSDTAYDGVGATGRATISANVWGSDAGNDTIELNNVVTEQALGQLKAIFGGAPTEGERQILLDIQGSANQPKKVRDEIYARARAAAERRAQYNRDRAADLRGGDYYNPGRTGTIAPQPVSPTGSNGRTSSGLSWSVD